MDNDSLELLRIRIAAERAADAAAGVRPSGAAPGNPPVVLVLVGLVAFGLYLEGGLIVALTRTLFFVLLFFAARALWRVLRRMLRGGGPDVTSQAPASWRTRLPPE